jgi:hypothetical protein
MDNGKDLLEMVVTGFETAEEDMTEDEEAFNFSEWREQGRAGGSGSGVVVGDVGAATQPSVRGDHGSLLLEKESSAFCLHVSVPSNHGVGVLQLLQLQLGVAFCCMQLRKRHGISCLLTSGVSASAGGFRIAVLRKGPAVVSVATVR